MTDLSKAHCQACRKDAPRVSEAELPALREQIPHWTLEQHEGVDQLQRTFVFKDFKQALAFTNAVGACAEAEQHHPALTTEWGKVSVRWWTHAIGGLHHNDFIMAVKTDALAARHLAQ